MMAFWSRLRCRISGHPGVFRRWEWRLSAPGWKEVTDQWTCIRCEQEMLDIPSTMPRYRVRRPFMDASLVDWINRTVEHTEQTGRTLDMRVLAGDPSTREPRPSTSE